MKENRWFWGAGDDNGRVIRDQVGERFVVAKGPEVFWQRIRAEVAPDERCSWDYINKASPPAEPTLAECMRVFLHAREAYGASYNRVTLEMAQIPAFAAFIREAPSDLCNWVSNPNSTTPLSRAAYDPEVETALGERIAATLNIEKDWWR